jgi:hypothetical protein
MVRITLVSIVIALLWSAAAHLAAAQGQSVRRGGVQASQQVTCDIGPPAAVPVEAAAAGFTHCVANFDFSQSTYAVPAYNPTGVAGSWANCYGENNGKSDILWHGGSGGLVLVSPCNIKQKTDASDGSTVMNFEWRPTYAFQAGGGQRNQVSLMTYNQYASGHPALTVGNYYVQTISRLEASCPSSACPSNAGGPSDVYMYPTPGSYGTEIDILEFTTNALNGTSGTGVAAGNCGYSNGGNPCWANWTTASGSAIIGVSNYSNVAFHNYGALSTSDGVHDKRICMYIDDILQNSSGCLIEQGGAVGTNDTNFLTRNMIIVGASSNPGNAGQPIEFNVKNVIVWSCANYNQSGATGMCNGATLFSQVQGNGQTLAYYH